MVVGIICLVIAIGAFVISFFQFIEKGPLLNNAYFYTLTDEVRPPERPEKRDALGYTLTDEVRPPERPEKRGALGYTLTDEVRPPERPEKRDALGYTPKEQKNSMDKKPYYRQSGVVFIFIGIIFLLNAVQAITRLEWMFYGVIASSAGVVIYAIISTIMINKTGRKKG